jgi:hypothetical protein
MKSSCSGTKINAALFPDLVRWRSTQLERALSFPDCLRVPLKESSSRKRGVRPKALDWGLFAITRESVHSRTLALSFFGSFQKLVNLFNSILCTQSALNLEQKAEEALILFLCDTKPASVVCGANGDFWIAALLTVHRILLDSPFSATGQASPILCSYYCNRF